MSNVIEIDLTEKVYKKRANQVSVLNNFSLTVSEQERVAVVGESGAGKSSLLNILGLIDQDYAGRYELFGTDTQQLSQSQRAQWRNSRVGFVLQESALIQSLKIEDNIRLPLLYTKSNTQHDEAWFDQLIDALGIGHILSKKPLDCSGGEKARAVFARGVLLKPALILADEPTASLDSENRQRIIDLLFQMNREYGATVVTVTHDLDFADQHDRVITLERKG